MGKRTLQEWVNTCGSELHLNLPLSVNYIEQKLTKIYENVYYIMDYHLDYDINGIMI